MDAHLVVLIDDHGPCIKGMRADRRQKQHFDFRINEGPPGRQGIGRGARGRGNDKAVRLVVHDPAAIHAQSQM